MFSASNDSTNVPKNVTLNVLSRQTRACCGLANVCLTITDDALKQARTLAKVAAEHGMSEARCFAKAQSWGRNDDCSDMDVTQTELVVYPNGIFYLTGEETQSGFMVMTALVKIERLQSLFEDSTPGKAMTLSL